MADDVYLIDVEVHFAHGDPIIEQLIEGRDKIGDDNGSIIINIELDPDSLIVYEIDRKQVNYTKTTRRKLEPEVKPGWE